jgi:hypothetical protein
MQKLKSRINTLQLFVQAEKPFRKTAGEAEYRLCKAHIKDSNGYRYLVWKDAGKVKSYYLSITPKSRHPKVTQPVVRIKTNIRRGTKKAK